MSLNRWDVPDSWTWVTAGDVAAIVGGGTPSTKDDRNFAQSGIPWIGPADLTGYKNAYIGRGRRDLSEKGLRESGATVMPTGTVLFSSRAPIGYCAIAANPISTNQGFKSWICADGIVPEFARLYLLASTEYADSLASGTTFREISGKRVTSMAFPLVPTNEQRRIVAKLDSLTALLARARAELDRIAGLVRTLRRPVIRKEVRELILANGDVEAREHFTWASGKFLPTKAQRGGEIPVYGGNGVNGWHDEANVESRTIVVGRVGAQCGNVHITEGPAWITDNAIFARQVSTAIDLDFSLYAFRDAELIHQAAGTGQPYVNREALNSVRLPNADAGVQRTSAMRIKGAFARADRLEAEAARARALLDRLESSILAKAFRGELVPQDPNDEPANVLLDRIRAQRAAAPQAKRGRNPKETTA